MRDTNTPIWRKGDFPVVSAANTGVKFDMLNKFHLAYSTLTHSANPFSHGIFALEGGIFDIWTSRKWVITLVGAPLVHDCLKSVLEYPFSQRHLIFRFGNSWHFWPVGDGDAGHFVVESFLRLELPILAPLLVVLISGLLGYGFPVALALGLLLLWGTLGVIFLVFCVFVLGFPHL